MARANERERGLTECREFDPGHTKKHDIKKKRHYKN